MSKKSKKLKWIGGIVLSLVVIIVLVVAFLWRIIDNEDDQMRRYLNNPHINEGFSSWHSFEIPEIGTFYYPEGWRLLQSENGCTLISQDGRITGYGTAIGIKAAAFSSGAAFWSDCYNCDIKEVRYLPGDSFEGITHIGKGFLAKWTVGDDIIYVITLNVETAGETQKYFTMAFASEQFESETEFRQLAEAIIYAFSYI